MDVVQINAPVNPTAAIVTEWDPLYSREAAAMAPGASSLQLQVLGAVPIGAVSSAVKAAGANTGNGTLVMDASNPSLANYQPGLYQVRCIAAAANAATFRVTDPKGDVLGDINYNGAGASAAFADQIKFAVTDGSTDFVVGDGYDITVLPGVAYKPLNLAATDGSQNAAGVGLYASDSDGNVTVLARGPIVLRADMLQWPVGATAAQIATGVAQLAALGVIVRATG